MTSQTPANGTPEGDSSRPMAPAALEGERQHLATKEDLAKGLATLYRLMLWQFIVLTGMMVAVLSSILAMAVLLARDSHTHPAGELHTHPPAGQQVLAPGPQGEPAPSADR